MRADFQYAAKARITENDVVSVIEIEYDFIFKLNIFKLQFIRTHF